MRGLRHETAMAIKALKDEPCEWRERRRNEIDPEDSVPAEDVARRLKQRGLGDQDSA